MTTAELTIQQQYELLKKLSENVKLITEELRVTKNELANTTDVINSYTIPWSESIKNYEKIHHDINPLVEALKKQVGDSKEETDRFKQYLKGIDENLEARLTNFKERFENLHRTLEILEQNVKSIREIDLNSISERIKKLPNLETIRKELSNSTTPLVTESDFNSLEQKVSNVKGSLNSHFRNSLIGLFILFATIIGSQVVAYYTIISKIEAVSTPENSSATTNTVIPSPSKPTP